MWDANAHNFAYAVCPCSACGLPLLSHASSISGKRRVCRRNDSTVKTEMTVNSSLFLTSFFHRSRCQMVSRTTTPRTPKRGAPGKQLANNFRLQHPQKGANSRARMISGRGWNFLQSSTGAARRVLCRHWSGLGFLLECALYWWHHWCQESCTAHRNVGMPPSVHVNPLRNAQTTAAFWITHATFYAPFKTALAGWIHECQQAHRNSSPSHKLWGHWGLEALVGWRSWWDHPRQGVHATTLLQVAHSTSWSGTASTKCLLVPSLELVLSISQHTMYSVPRNSTTKLLKLTEPVQTKSQNQIMHVSHI